MIGTVMPPLEQVPVHIVVGEDGGKAASEALAYERAAVWVGDAGSPEYEEFVAEVARPRLRGGQG